MTGGWVIPGLPEGPLPASVSEVLDCLAIEYDERGWGDEAPACCPVHDDTHPSASFNTVSGLWHCHACGEGGNLAHLVELVLDVPYSRARRWLRGVDYSAEFAAREPGAELEWDESGLSDFDRPPAAALRDRGISSRVARRFGIKWAAEDKAWVLPVRDADGVLRGWQTKAADETRTTPGTRKSRTLFGIDKFRPGSAAILVESPLDCAVLLTAGLDGGIASFGAHVSRAQAALLHQRAGRLVIALDADDAGRAGQQKLLERLAAIPGPGKPVLAFNYGTAKGKDPGELSDEELHWGIRHAAILSAPKKATR